jgi:hypothetical protein
MPGRNGPRPEWPAREVFRVVLTDNSYPAIRRSETMQYPCPIQYVTCRLHHDTYTMTMRQCIQVLLKRKTANGLRMRPEQV